jgi:hypothetical protein
MAKRRNRTSTLQPLPSLVAEKPPAQQRTNETVMKAEWLDPTDSDPRRRVLLTASGYRRTCQLRRCLARLGHLSRFTEVHALAADRLRVIFDGAMLGFSALRDWRPVQSVQFRVSPGPTTTAMRQLRCRQAFDQVWSLFTVEVRAILALVVLRREGVTAAAATLGLRKALLTQCLIEALDRLCLWFDIGPRRSGRRPPPLGWPKPPLVRPPRRHVPRSQALIKKSRPATASSQPNGVACRG